MTFKSCRGSKSCKCWKRLKFATFNSRGFFYPQPKRWSRVQSPKVLPKSLGATLMFGNNCQGYCCRMWRNLVFFPPQNIWKQQQQLLPSITSFLTNQIPRNCCVDALLNTRLQPANSLRPSFERRRKSSKLKVFLEKRYV